MLQSNHTSTAFVEYNPCGYVYYVLYTVQKKIPTCFGEAVLPFRIFYNQIASLKLVKIDFSICISEMMPVALFSSLFGTEH